MDTWRQLRVHLGNGREGQEWVDISRPVEARAHLAETELYWEYDRLAWWGALLLGRFSGRAYPEGYFITDFTLAEKPFGFCVFITIEAAYQPTLKLFAKGKRGKDALKDARNQMRAGWDCWKPPPVRKDRDK